MNKSLRAYSRNMSFEWRLFWKSSLFRSFLIMFVAGFSFFMISFAVRAQQVFKVTGTVKDESGETLIGVSVKIKNGKGGATTDKNGNYSVNLDDKNAILVLSMLVMIRKRRPLPGLLRLL